MKSLTSCVIQHVVLTVTNAYLILALFPLATIPAWIFVVLVALAVVVDVLALAWAFGNLPDRVGAETVGAIWAVEHVIQIIALVTIVSTIYVPFAFLYFVALLYWGKLRQGVIGKMFDARS